MAGVKAPIFRRCDVFGCTKLLEYLIITAEAKRKQQAEAENKTDVEVSELLKYKSLPQQKLDQSNGAVQQLKPAEKVGVTQRLLHKPDMSANTGQNRRVKAIRTAFCADPS